MGLFAPPAPYVRERLGSRWAMALSLLVIAAFGVARAFVPGIAGLLLLTVGVGIGMGIAGALLPVVVKERFADRPAFATGTYATGIGLGAALSAAVAVPIADAAFGWRASLLAFSLFTGLLVVVWVLLTRGDAGPRASGERPPRLPVRQPARLGPRHVFFLMATSFYGLNAWLPDAYVEQGWSKGSAGALVAVFNAVTVPASLIVPWFADRAGSRRAYLVSATAILIVAMLGAVLYPEAGWFWAVLMGLAFGTQFPLVMTLPLDVARRPAEVGAVTGLMLGAGYTLAALSPFVLGAIRDATGSFSASLWADRRRRDRPCCSSACRSRASGSTGRPRPTRSRRDRPQALFRRQADHRGELAQVAVVVAQAAERAAGVRRQVGLLGDAVGVLGHLLEGLGPGVEQGPEGIRLRVDGGAEVGDLRVEGVQLAIQGCAAGAGPRTQAPQDGGEDERARDAHDERDLPGGEGEGDVGGAEGDAQDDPDDGEAQLREPALGARADCDGELLLVVRAHVSEDRERRRRPSSAPMVPA